MKVKGLVKNAATGAPVAGVKVVLAVGERELAVLFSDREGRFEHMEEREYVGQKLNCRVEKEGFEPQEATYKIGPEDIRLDIELVPEEPEAEEKIPPPRPPSPPSPRKWLKIAIGIAAVIVVAIGAYFVISHERRPEPEPAPRPGEVRVPQRPSVAPLPDLYISEFSLSPSTPTQGKPVKVRVGVYNRGSAKAKPFTVEWWAGENFPKPAKVWQVNGSAAKGGRILTYTYDGYRSWYGKLTTKAVADSKGKVKEQNEHNNVRKMEIQVRKK